MYSPQVIDHFEHPRNVGEVPNANAAVQVENPACGDIMSLSLLVANGKIVSARFRSRGCVAAIACGSAMTEMLHGLKLEEARKLGPESILQALGELNPEQKHATHLAMDALKAAIAKL